MPNVQASFNTKLGTRCHQQQDGQVPVAIITDLENNILIQHKASDKTSYWVVSRVRVHITRIWACSTAFIKCVCEMLNNDEPLPLISNVKPFRPSTLQNSSNEESIKDTEEKYQLGVGDEICIYTGYLNNIGDKISKEDLGNRFLRVFVGSIDVITEACNPNEGASLIIECRDRMKYLMDSLSSYSSAEALPQDNSQTGVDEASKSGKERRDFIMSMARNAVGDFTNSKCTASGCGYRIFDGAPPSDYDIDYYYDNKNENSVVTPISGQKPTSKMPTFEILSGRLKFSNDTTSNFAFPVVTERVAVEHIKYLSLQEPYYTELFAHNVNGNFYYIPKQSDVSSLTDPYRFYRTYFNRIAPPGLGKLYNKDIDLLHPCQMAIMYQEENSTIAWRSNVILRNVNNSQSGIGNEKIVHMKTIPPRYKDRGFPCSYLYVSDPSLEKPADYLAVGLSYLRRVSKETRSAELHIIGDPSILPGELIQVVGSINKLAKVSENQTSKNVLEKALKDRGNCIEYINKYKEEAMTLSSNIKNGTINGSSSINAVGINNTVEIPIIKPEATTNTLCPIDTNSQKQIEEVNFDYDNEVTTIWRVESVRHRLNDGWAGFRTELALLPPF